MEQLIEYLIRLTPASVVYIFIMAVVPKNVSVPRIAVHILFFVLARDAMTGNDFWQITSGSLRFTTSSEILLALAAISTVLIATIIKQERVALTNATWIKVDMKNTILLGIVGAIGVSVVAAMLKGVANLESVPKPQMKLWPVLLAFSLIGNMYEELLFRGAVQTKLHEMMNPIRAILASGAIFCMCHTFLAITVTSIGAPVLIFTLIEGMVAAYVYHKAGLVASSLTHGLAIFILAIGTY